MAQPVPLGSRDRPLRMLEPLQGRLRWLFQQTDDPKVLCEEHTHLYEAIASGDPDRAAAEAIRHVRHNREVAQNLLFPEA